MSALLLYFYVLLSTKTYFRYRFPIYCNLLVGRSFRTSAIVLRLEQGNRSGLTTVNLVTSLGAKKTYFSEGSTFYLKLYNVFRKKGAPISYTVVTNFFVYLKWRYSVNAIRFLALIFFRLYVLPFKVSSVTMSNRNYLFPDTFRNDKEWERFLMKKLGSILKKRPEGFFSARLFSEILDYLKLSSLSVLRQQLDSVFSAGLENRAYIHYRWMRKS